MEKQIKVLLIEDDSDFVYLIKKEIEKDERLKYIGYASNKALGTAMAREHNPAVVVTDLNLSGSELDGIDAAKEIRLTTGAKILLLTSFEQPDIVIDAAKKSFASGYIFKSQCSTLLTDTIYKIATSKTPQELFIRELLVGELTSAERSVLNDLITGNTKAAVSSSLKTIANQKTSIFKKLGLRNTDELFAVFRDW
jgi:DNA-binding NarL/FixJ family response regulator